RAFCGPALPRHELATIEVVNWAMFCQTRKIKPVIPAQAGIYNKPAKTLVRKAISLAFWLGALWISAFAEMTFSICLLTIPATILQARLSLRGNCRQHNNFKR
ncbi:MAG TPA: hypothetical protein PLW39_13980, partial [Thermoflexales bacterium]|nr:hypothetical protein [Thermoflexales bacterium]